MHAQGLIAIAQNAIYEPETCAFGGPDGMTIAHRPFHTDSHNILAHLNTPAPPSPGPAIGRRELSILLCTRMMRGTRQDWHEQGDIWHQVTQLRPIPPGTPLERLHDTASALRQLVSTETRPGCNLTDNHAPLAFASGWATGFEQTGNALADAATAARPPGACAPSSPTASSSTGTGSA
jgi:thiopeptide-type bacteriocin biosynthesis protein